MTNPIPSSEEMKKLLEELRETMSPMDIRLAFPSIFSYIHSLESRLKTLEEEHGRMKKILITRTKESHTYDCYDGDEGVPCSCSFGTAKEVLSSLSQHD